MSEALDTKLNLLSNVDIKAASEWTRRFKSGVRDEERDTNRTMGRHHEANKNWPDRPSSVATRSSDRFNPEEFPPLIASHHNMIMTDDDLLQLRGNNLLHV